MTVTLQPDMVGLMNVTLQSGMVGLTVTLQSGMVGLTVTLQSGRLHSDDYCNITVRQVNVMIVAVCRVF